jgi:alginate O-acetyltransferase complex protein AlgI
MGKSWSTLEIILPIGISYYIFSAIAYLLDVNWQTIEYNGNVLDIALYMAFFPKVVCGPIANAKEFLPQLKEKTRITSDNISLGLQIVVMGLFKKLVIAGNLGLFVDDVYAAPAAYATITVWLAVFSYFVELYFDFSGYSDIAIGISRLFGYKIERNFNLPFVSRNISEFWERWHISLSTWLNEYIFNPVAMGLRRKIASLPKDKKRRYKNIPTYVALIVTFLVCGIWHGAGWTFILWGLLQGICSCIHERYVNYMKKNHRNFAQNKGKGVIVADIVANFFTMNMIQMVMRASSVGDVVIILRRMFTQQSGIVWFSVWIIVAYIALIAEMILAYHKNNNSFRNIQGVYLINDLSTVKGLTLFFIFVGITAIFGYFGDTNFIYAQF